jgi:hypothetical protein
MINGSAAETLWLSQPQPRIIRFATFGQREARAAFRPGALAIKIRMNRSRL